MDKQKLPPTGARVLLTRFHPDSSPIDFYERLFSLDR